MCTIAAIAYPAWLVLNRTAVEESFTESILKAPVTEPGKVTNNSPIELLPVGPRTPQPNWFGDQTKFDELTEQSKVLQANLDQTWEVMPQLIEPPHLPTPPK